MFAFEPAYMIFNIEVCSYPNFQIAMNRLKNYMKARNWPQPQTIICSTGLIPVLNNSGFLSTLLDPATDEDWEQERPAARFMGALKSMLDDKTAIFGELDKLNPIKEGQTLIGWKDKNGDYLLDPLVAFSAVCQYYRWSGRPFIYTHRSTWKDLDDMGFIICEREGRYTKIVNSPLIRERVIQLKKSAVDESEPEK
jgi:hypothetical protein